MPGSHSLFSAIYERFGAHSVPMLYGGLDQASPLKLRQIVDKLKGPVRGPVSDPAFSYRNRAGELNDSDQAVIDELTGELKEDWEEESGE